MSEEKLITVLTPLYNKARFLKTYVEGLARQSYLDKMRIIVLNDCSTDNGAEILTQHAAEFNVPIELMHNKRNMGLVYSTFKLYRLINTKYWAFLDPDDYYLSPDKVKKAVDFLEAHEDFSCYGCTNLSEFSDGRKIPTFPPQNPGGSFVGLKNAPFLQTASATFRNYFTPKLLDLLDKITYGKRRSSFESDGFRNFLAHHFGKFYFDNSLDSVWRRDVGMWGTDSLLNHNLGNMTTYFEFYKFSKEQWGVDDNAMTCLNLSVRFYNMALDELTAHMKKLDVVQFEEAVYKNKDEKTGRHTFDELLKQVKLYNAAGVRIQTK